MPKYVQSTGTFVTQNLVDRETLYLFLNICLFSLFYTSRAEPEQYWIKEPNFGKDCRLCPQVSDHYPVSFCLKPALHPDLAKNIRTKVRIVVQDRRFPQSISPARLAEDLKIPKYKVSTSRYLKET